ncbi:hypothetical protein NQT69_14955 [Pseudoalteromonas shioyasakiensis]|uniref:hypothetical protein n=1 Tax=Pseudoalteromonas shioyasakiensis TaxID=1190813 RepID=UPI002118F22D|nr:hypothetical protein [Pseudoalteromonas shioyasakiensis]MCQ8879309.1 hypothetical protein [Pseudoalteromonas shioyasakiensis]
MAKVLIVVMVTLLSGCTSSQVMSSGCDFVVGSGKSQQRQVQNSSLANSDTNQEMNVINGVLQMLLGPLSRALGDDECEAQEQLYQYPSVAL